MTPRHAPTRMQSVLVRRTFHAAREESPRQCTGPDRCTSFHSDGQSHQGHCFATWLSFQGLTCVSAHRNPQQP
eukprot:358811-Chlamydomonas_euryale.AAC.15